MVNVLLFNRGCVICSQASRSYYRQRSVNAEILGPLRPTLQSGQSKRRGVYGAFMLNTQHGGAAILSRPVDLLQNCSGYTRVMGQLASVIQHRKN